LPALAAQTRVVAAPPPEALRVERKVVHAADEFAGPHPLGGLAAALVRAVPLVAAALTLLIALTSPGEVIYPAPGQRDLRDAFARTHRLARFGQIDRAARTYHLLEGRYPASITELVERGLLPRRSLGKIDGQRLDYRPRSEEYEISLSPGGSQSADVREGVFGDFLLDRTLFANLDRDAGVPVVLVD